MKQRMDAQTSELEGAGEIASLFLALFSSSSYWALNKCQTRLLRGKHLIIEEEPGCLPVSGAGIMQYKAEQVILGEVMAWEKLWPRRGKCGGVERHTLHICMVMCLSET